MGGVYTRCKKGFEEVGVHGIVDSSFTSKNVENFMSSAQNLPTTRVAEDIVIYGEDASVG